MPSARVLQSSLLATFVLSLAAQTPGPPKPIFYNPTPYGSDSAFNPFTSVVNWTFDTLQVPESFDEYQARERWGMVRENLLHPGRAVATRGGWSDFINRQVIPYRMSEPDWLPNWSLHLVGGGMLYRKKAEWFEAKGMPAPYLMAGLLTVVEELAAEAIEKASTKPDDEVADVLVFLPAAMLLFNNDTVARFAADKLQLVEWQFQPVYDPNAVRPWGTRGRLTNAGQSFVIRPDLFNSREVRPFAHFGMTNLVGLSHKMGATDAVSWGIGASMVHAQDPTRTRFTGGVFWDRNGSLLASLFINGTDRLRARLNVYPGIVGGKRWWSPGLYVGLGDKGDLNVGVTFRFLPVGLARLAPSTNRQLWTAR